HVGGVQPQEERLTGSVLTLDEVFCCRHKFVVACLHALAIERAGVFDSLFSDAAPPRLLSVVFLVRRVTAEHAAGSEPLLESRILRVIRVLGIFLGVEVIEVAEKLIEAVYGRQKPVHVSQVVFAELPGGVTERLEELRNRRILYLQSNGRARN